MTLKSIKKYLKKKCVYYGGGTECIHPVKWIWIGINSYSYTLSSTTVHIK